MQRAKVSIIIAAYKATRYLERTLASVAAQTFTDFEVLVRDDSSEAAIETIVAARRDDRFRYVANTERLGVARNHWSGIAAATGQYVAIVNHDDTLRPTHLEVLVRALDADPGVCLAFCDHDVIDSNDRTLPHASDDSTRKWRRDRLRAGRQDSTAALVVHQAVPMAIGAVFRREAISIDDLRDVGPAYDLWLTYLLARTGRPFWYEPARLASWRVHETQITAVGDAAWTAGAYACWKAIAADAMFRPAGRGARRALAAASARLAYDLRRRGSRPLATQHALEAVRTHPASPGIWLRALRAVL